jgi:hypothetical protein
MNATQWHYKSLSEDEKKKYDDNKYGQVINRIEYLHGILYHNDYDTEEYLDKIRTEEFNLLGELSGEYYEQAMDIIEPNRHSDSLYWE